MIRTDQAERPLRILLCTIPLDVGLSRAAYALPVMPKIAIVSIIKWMEKHGFTREQYDFYDIDMLDPSDGEIGEYFKSYNPTVIGFSATVSTTYTQVKRIAAIAREACPNAWLVLGGSLSASARVVLHKTKIDVCVQGDGEIPWVEFLDYVKCYERERNYELLAGIKGLTFLDSRGEMQFNGYPARIPASENPFPDYELLKIGLRSKPETVAYYFREGRVSAWFQQDPRTQESHRCPKMAALWTTKGCVARCTFCQRSTKGYQTNSVTSLDEHLAELRERYDVGFIQVIDENFGSDRRHSYEVARAMQRHNMLWICGGVRCVSVTEEDVTFYKAHGCCGLKFGIESGSQKILDLMEKNFTVQQVYEAVKHCYVHNVFSPLAVMTAMPGETDETAMQTGVFLGNLARMYGAPPESMGMGTFYALPLPGTPLYEYGQQAGVIGTSVNDEEKYLIAISDRNADKGNHININGAPLKRLLFWDFLIRYEASRTYYSKPLDSECVTEKRFEFQSGALPTEIHGVDHDRLDMEKMYPSLGSALLRSIQATRRSLREDPRGFLRNILLYGRIGIFINNRLIAMPIVAKLPRLLVYGPMRNLVYVEFLLTKLVRRVLRLVGVAVEPRNLFNDYKFPPPITDEMLAGKRLKERSLRGIVNQQREATPIPLSITDRNQQILVQGR